MSHWRRLGGASIALVVVLIVGTIGYVVLGFGLLDALYQTVTTISTVGFREVEPLSPAGQMFTIVLIQSIGGARMAAFVLRPHVAEFLDVVMRERALEFRLEEVPVSMGSPIVGRSLRDSHLRDRTGALVLALRDADGTFQTNPSPDLEIRGGQVIIAIGTQDELDSLVAVVEP